MQQFNPEKISFKQFAFVLIAGFMVSFIVVNFTGPENPRKILIDGDGSGYYDYLPAVLIHHTVDFTTVFESEKTRRSSDYQGHYFHQHDGILINKYTSGTALMQLPFFMVAWIVSILFSFPVDGYNILFQYMAGVAAMFWAAVGMLFFLKLALLFDLDKKIAMITGLVGLFATNLFFYIFIAPSASHVYSFAAITMLFYFTRKIFKNYHRRDVWIAAFLLGLVTLIRPVNFIVVAALPFLAGSPGQFKNAIKIKLRKKDYFPAMLFFLLAITPQLIINILQTSNPIVDSYPDEGFYFLHPEFINFLFSFRKGWFIYTPFMLLLIPATFYLLKRSFYEMITFIGFFILLVYVFSSWWNWIYGDSFGMRPMVDFYALFLLVIALFAKGLNRNYFKNILLVFTLLAIFLNLFQTYQYAEGIIHPDSMTKKAYWYVFLKTGKSFKHVVAGEDEYFYGKLDDQPFFQTYNTFDNEAAGWTTPKKLYFIPDADHACIRLDENSVFSSTFRYQIPDSLTRNKNLYVIFSAKYLEPAPNSAEKALFVVDISDTTNKSVFYKAFKIKRLPDNLTDTWRTGHIGFKLPEITSNMKTIKFYIWDKEKREFYIHSLEVRFYMYSK